jgi:peptide/nickel transport system substrate-binding protein
LGRYIRWQAILALTGIAMTMAFLSFLSLSRTTISVPDVGGVYTEAIAGTPQFINPLLSQYNQADQDIGALIFNGLTRMDGSGNIETDLAQSWEISSDGLVYVFQLKRDIRWQDGTPFTADDVIFTLSLMQDPEFPGVPYLRQLWEQVTVEKLDRYTVRFMLPEPFPAFMEFTTIGILPEHILGDIPARDLLNHPFNQKPIGTGPFTLDTIDAQTAQLSANPFYSGAKSRLGKIAFEFFPSHLAAINAYQNGTVNALGSIPPENLPSVQALTDLNLYTARLSGYNIIYLNLQTPETTPFFQEPQVRRAMLIGLDRQAIIDTSLNGQGIVANGPVLPWSWAYDHSQERMDFDSDLARTLLDESGWIDSNGDGIRDQEGIPFTFSLLTGEEPAKIDMANTISDQWQQLGISATVKIAGATLGEQLANHTFDAALAEVLLSGDPDPYPFWHQSQIDGGQNYAGWHHETASQLLETARTITDTGRRSDYYFEFQELFAEDTPALVINYPTFTFGVNKEVFGVQTAPMRNPSDRFKTVADWYMLTRQVVYTQTQLQ